MNNDEKIVYLNHIITNKENISYEGPKLLYKYRPFDEYTFDMLENQYLFLCPAEKEDDETECLTTIDFNRLIDLKTNNLKKECVSQIINLIKPYANEKSFEITKNVFLGEARKDGTIPPYTALELSMELQNLIPEGVNIAPFVNWIVGIPEMLDKPEISNTLKELFLMAHDARKNIGICSLAENMDIEYMRNNYAADSSGYCVEYDLENYDLSKNILPVIYEDNRETNILMQLVGSFIGQMINGLSNGAAHADSTHFIRLFLTKNTKREYQKEWRYLGEVYEKPKAPKIKTIYLGKNVSAGNEKKMRDYALKNDIEIKKVN